MIRRLPARVVTKVVRHLRTAAESVLRHQMPHGWVSVLAAIRPGWVKEATNPSAADVKIDASSGTVEEDVADELVLAALGLKPRGALLFKVTELVDEVVCSVRPPRLLAVGAIHARLVPSCMG